MRALNIRFTSLAASFLTVVLSGAAPPVFADDTEIFLAPASTNGNANILLILDSSGSMEQVAVEGTTVAPYDSEYEYDNDNTNCSRNYVYYTTSETPPTSCNIGVTGGVGGRIPNRTADGLTNRNKCLAARTALAYGDGVHERPGFYTDRFIRWGGSGSSRTWSPSMSVNNGTDVECFSDRGTDGNLSNSNTYPRSGTANQGNGRWGSSGQTWWSGTNVGTQLWFWSPNYIRYQRNPTYTDNQSRMSVLKAAAVSFVQSASNVNIGLMRYANNNNFGNNDAAADGGVVLVPVGELTSDHRTALINAINGIHPAGYTPLSETLYEAHLYLSGGDVLYGRTESQNSTNPSRACSTNYVDGNGNGQCLAGDNELLPSVAASRVGGLQEATQYRTPIGEACQQNFIIYLTDGLPTQDNGADEAIEDLGVDCGDDDEDGRCLAGLSGYMNGLDYYGNTTDGTQNVRTFYIGFGSTFEGGLTDAFNYLNDAAIAGGTEEAHTASSLPDLSNVFNRILDDINDESTTFTAPTVAVNAFNRTQNLDDIYVSVFKPSSEFHWPGNVKKYKFRGGEIRDANNNAAVNASTGFFNDTSRSFWSASVDGSNVEAGGAASKLPAPADRKIYTYLGANPTSPTAFITSAFAVTSTNTFITDEMIGLTGAEGEPTRENVMNFARGQDVLDEDEDSSTTRRYSMGASLHAQPTVVIYGGTPDEPDIDDAVIFQPTNDGYLHAFEVGSESPVTDGGNELWAFIPKEHLTNLVDLYNNDPSAHYNYALDGEVRVLKYDVNGDGIIDPEANDRVFIYFSDARGGLNYYALDVTYKENPKYMWRIGPSQLPGVGHTWSTPTITRMNINGATQNSQKLVLVMGGGYNPAQDDTWYMPEDNMGNRIFIVDALYGTLLWSAGPEDSGANLELARMTHSIPARVTTMDLNSDGFADRMYVGDVAAQIWRFDITNADNAETDDVVENDANNFVAGGVIASLGTKDADDPIVADARRFYNDIDAVVARDWPNPPFINLAIGSGHRGHPLNQQIQDRFYSIRDHRPFAKMTQDEYDDVNREIISDSSTGLVNLLTATEAIPSSAKGWKLELREGTSWVGEKVLGASTTIDYTIYFPSYMPNQGSTEACVAPTGTNRAYAVRLLSGAGASVDDEGETSRFEDLAQGGIAPEVTTIFCPTCMQTDPPPGGEPPPPPPGACLSGVEVLRSCRLPEDLLKTYWRENNLN